MHLIKNTYENVDSLLVKFTNKVSTKYVINIYIYSEYIYLLHT